MSYPRMHPFVSPNAGAPNITRNPSPPEYKATSEPHQVASISGGGSEIPTIPGPDIGAALSDLGVKQGHQEQPHPPEQRPAGEGKPAGEGAAEAGEGVAEAGEAAEATLGAGEAAGGALAEVGLVGGLL